MINGHVWPYDKTYEAWSRFATLKYDDSRLKMAHLSCALMLHFQPRVYHISVSTHYRASYVN